MLGHALSANDGAFVRTELLSSFGSGHLTDEFYVRSIIENIELRLSLLYNTKAKFQFSVNSFPVAVTCVTGKKGVVVLTAS